LNFHGAIDSAFFISSTLQLQVLALVAHNARFWKNEWNGHSYLFLSFVAVGDEGNTVQIVPHNMGSECTLISHVSHLCHGMYLVIECLTSPFLTYFHPFLLRLRPFTIVTCVSPLSVGAPLSLSISRCFRDCCDLCNLCRLPFTVSS